MCSAKNDIHLSEEQQFFIQTALEGRNILVDACIGSGKTTAIQELCNQLPDEYSILYLTYNRLLKLDAQEKIKKKNVTVTNYHGFAFSALRKAGISSNVAEVIQTFNKVHPPIPNYTVLVLDEYQDIELELAEMLTFIKDSCPGMQIIAVGDMEQKIYDKTTLDVPRFINHFLGEYSKLNFTKCFRLSPALAEKLGRIWEKPIIGVNENCLVEEMNITQVIDFLASQKSQDILCLGMRNGDMADALNTLESKYPKHFNKNTVLPVFGKQIPTVPPDPNGHLPFSRPMTAARDWNARSVSSLTTQKTIGGAVSQNHSSHTQFCAIFSASPPVAESSTSSL